jgi:hypothetical protein
MNNSEWERRLRQACQEAGLKAASRVAFTRDIQLGGTEEAATLALSAEGVCANMQSLDASFEGWCLVLYAWLGVDRVTLSWAFPEQREDPHYRRFLYRVRRFKEVFGERFGVELRGARELEAFMPRGDYVLNLAGAARSRLEDTSEPASDSERAQETFIVSSPEVSERLRQLCGLVTLDNQLPVGVFRDGRVSTASRFFSGGFVDLWGLSERDRLVLFELKNEDNVSLGALSELLFYAMLLRDAQRPDEGEPLVRFSDDARSADAAFRKIPGTRGVDAYLLAPRFHPLVEGDGARLVQALQEALQASGLQIDFGLIRMDAGHGFERLV